MSNSIDELKVYFPLLPKIPDPANIKNTGQWYLLGHISSGLTKFNHVKGRFEPLLAQYESYSSGVHTFVLSSDAKFNDGTQITASDVVASLKRLIILKSSTHFPMWDYIEGCSNLAKFADECSGLRIISEQKLEIRLKQKVESFLLQMSSPETGIWAASDIDTNDPKLTITPTKYSGPYFVKALSEKEGFVLEKNPYNPTTKEFADAPKKILIPILKSDQVPDELKNSKLDVVIRSHNPYDATPIEKFGYSVFSSSPSTLLYLHATGNKPKNLITKEFIETLWRNNTDSGITPADKFLPFDPGLSLTKEEFISEIPSKDKAGGNKIKVGVPWTYLTQTFYDFIANSAKQSQLDLEIVVLNREEWFAGHEQVVPPKGVDYILGVYAASERYPAVQLRYISGSLRHTNIDLTEAETPELSLEKKEILKNYQKTLLKNQYAIPLFLAKHQMTYKSTLDIGDQPPSDAEIELWRVVKK